MITLIGNGHPLEEISLKTLSGYLNFHQIPTRIIYLTNCSKLTDQAIKKILEITAGSLIIGFSLMSKDLDIFLPIINSIKKNQNIPVVLGGIHPTALPKESLEFADFVCIGEGEEPLRQLYKALEKKTNNFNIPNIGYKNGEKKVINPITYFVDSLDNLPFPDYVFRNSYMLFPKNNEIKKIPTQLEEKRKFFEAHDHTTLLFYSQRGCNFACTYCSNSLYHKLVQGSKHKWHRNTSVQRVKEELKTHLNNLPFIRLISINDDNFLVRDIKEIEEIAMFIKNELNKPFTINATPSFVTEEKVSVLVKCGLKQIALGVQSGSEKILKNVYRRAVTNKQVLETAEITSKFQGLNADYGFILDNPYENDDDWRESLRLWISLPQRKTLSLYTLEFFPGTELTNRAISDGYLASLSSEFNKNYRRDIKYSYINSLFFLNMVAIPKWLNNLLMSDVLVKSRIAAPIRFLIKNRYPVELAVPIIRKIKYKIKCLIKKIIYIMSNFFKHHDKSNNF